MRLLATAAALVLGVLIAPGAGMAQDLVAETDPKTPEEERKALRLPPGFEIQLVASEPDIYKPMNLAFDEQGRLWVTSSIEYPFPPEDGTPGRDRVTILSNFGPDGRARSVTQFAEDLTIPIGLLPLSSKEALVHSIPHILRLTDTDGDGKADDREVVLREYGFQDTHGMTNAFTLGFDGWIYACHGFSNTSTVEAKDGEAITMQSGNTYRFRPDGSAIEQWTWGQVNPFGLTLDSLGNLWSCDCHTLPIYHLLRGAYYPSFGKPHDGLGFGPAVMQHLHGSTGIAGITYYEADHFPEEWRGTIFVGNPVTARVNHDRISWAGSSPTAIEQPDFIISDDPWFRPVDIKLGPDGALYIADFYNRIIGHYEVPLTHPGRDRDRGRIWRIIYVGEDGSNPPPTMPRADWGAASVADLINDLAHPNLKVRLRATDELANRADGEAIVPALLTASADDGSAERRVHALWALDRRGALPEDRLAAALADEDRAVRTHAVKILAERSAWDEDQRAAVDDLLADSDPFVRRAAADAMGRHPDPSQIASLLDAWSAADPADTHLVHVVRMALRDQLRSANAWASLPDPLTEADESKLAEVALGVPTVEAASFLLGHLRANPKAVGDVSRFVEHVARYGGESSQSDAREYARSASDGDLRQSLALLRAVHRGVQARGNRLDELSRSWAEEVAGALLASTEDRDRIDGIEVTGTLRLGAKAETLESILIDRNTTEPLRLAAIDARTSIDPVGAVGPLSRLLGSADETPSIRDRAAEALGRTGRPESDGVLLEVLAIAPSRLQRTIAVTLSATRNGAEALLKCVEEGRAPAELLREPGVQIRMTNAGVEAMASRIETLTAGLPPADEGLRQFIDERFARFASLESKPDAEAGRAVFTEYCAGCHKIGSEGAEVGPQLDGVGIRGPLRVLEDILNPNLNVDQAFRATTLGLSDGRILTGLLLAEEGDVLVLADAEGKSQRIAVDEVEERTTSSLSPMPANFAERIPEEEFHELIAYLLSQQTKED
ncbi:PVC-type heme-binding CxxCH protein [Tautonia rosea]|uniref:PVC-type heme-binding CxxCH protein n=1 Tax=Tautonia rosea TaxID=2728037 RepID=UPI001472B475|nr:PVC-type heme-binding CxxCH protein [Tautonia rosea]